MDLLLKFAIDFVQHVETEEMITDYDLIAVVEVNLGNQLAVDQRAVGRAEIVITILVCLVSGSMRAGDAGMKARSARIVEAHVSFDRATNYYLVSLERNRHRHQFAAKGDERWPAFLLGRLYALVGGS